jgi:hypothetical protein
MMFHTVHSLNYYCQKRKSGGYKSFLGTFAKQFKKTDSCFVGFVRLHGTTSTGQMLVEDNIADFYLNLSAKSGIEPRYPL